MFLKARERYLY